MLDEAKSRLLREYISDNRLKYFLVTYGCQMNSHDSERIAGILEMQGYTAAREQAEADIIIFNTCCVRENAEKRVFGNVGALKQLKRKNPSLIVGVCGCMMQQEAVARRMARTFPFVSLIFGTHAMSLLPELIYEKLFNDKRTLRIDGEDAFFDFPAVREQPPVASVAIMQGCDNFCSYCIVPYVRGRERSRPSRDIIAEVASLAENGYKEVLLLGQNVNSYGKKLDGEPAFPELLRRLAHETDIERIRFMTSHPKDAGEELFSVMAEEPRVMPQLHLPVQSGSNRILSLMNRRYTREHYLFLIERARAFMPSISLSTDVIVGFPTETEQDFSDTMSLIGEVGFNQAYMFVYSKRTGTAAAKMEEQISEEVKKQRINELVTFQNDMTYRKNLGLVGTAQRVLIEGESKRGEGVCGRTEGGTMVNIEGEKQLIGSTLEVNITKAKRTTLFAELRERR